ncbi:MAG: hypothetical protein ACTHLZ_10505 [Tepidisphaeraceae bacterium]
MRTALASAVMIVLGLWLGGLVTLVIFVASLFVHDRTLASNAAPWLFHVFERYQLGLAGAAIVLLAISAAAMRTWQLAVATTAAVVAALLAVFEISYITPHVLSSRAIDPATFEHYHHMASTNYSIETVFVLIALAFASAAFVRLGLRGGSALPR